MQNNMSHTTHAARAEAIQRVRRHLMGPSALLETPLELLLAPHDIPVFLYTAKAHLPHLHRHCPPIQPIHGAGCGLTRDEALISALGEVIERYSATRCCATDTVRTSYRKLRRPGIHPCQFALYDQKQYAQPQFHFQPLRDDTELDWINGWSWTQQQWTYLPACFVYQLPCLNDTTCAFHTVSTGLACASDDTAARLAGLCEVIEREAIMIAWLYGLMLPRLQPLWDDPVLATLYSRIADTQVEATVLDATLPDIDLPVRIAMLEHRNSAGAAVGMAAHPNPIVAHRKALIEAIHTLNWLHQIQRKRPPALTRPADMVLSNFADHVGLYGQPEVGHYLDIWRHGPLASEPLYDHAADGSPQSHINHIIGQFGDLGFDVLTIDLTLPDVAAAGFHVVRTVVPGMVPLVPGRTPCLGGARLSALHHKLAWPAQYSPGQWNPHPHPFP